MNVFRFFKLTTKSVMLVLLIIILFQFFSYWLWYRRSCFVFCIKIKTPLPFLHLNNWDTVVLLRRFSQISCRLHWRLKSYPPLSKVPLLFTFADGKYDYENPNKKSVQRRVALYIKKWLKTLIEVTEKNDTFGLESLIRVTHHFLMIAHYLMFNDGMFDLNLATDTFRACKWIHINWLRLVSVFDVCDLCCLFN